VAKYISLKEYVLFQLTGQYRVDESMASSTGLFDITAKKWSTEALNFAHISSSQLSEVSSVMDNTLTLKPEIAKSWGISIDTQIILGATDGCLATLGAGIISEGKAVISIGASSAVRIAGKELLKDQQQRVFNYLLTDNCYISGGPGNNAGVVFEWFAKEFVIFQNTLTLKKCWMKYFNE
jgi:gluconokinase